VDAAFAAEQDYGRRIAICLDSNTCPPEGGRYMDQSQTLRDARTAPQPSTKTRVQENMVLIAIEPAYRSGEAV